MALLHDLRLTVRHLAKAPGYAVAAILTLGLAMGATSAIFSAVHAVLLRPLPITAPADLAVFWGAESARDRAVIELTYRNFQDWAGATKSLSQTAAVGSSTWTMVRATSSSAAPATRWPSRGWCRRARGRWIRRS